MTTGLIIDCDPGHDDAMAILYAARHLNLIGITTVFGNTSLANATRNAQGICALAGIKVPIAAGMSAPLVAAAVSAADIHGPSGLDGATLPEPACDVIEQHAVQFIIEQAKAANGELVLAPLGPLTNIAVALKIEPRLAGMIKCISMMGGSTAIGNITPHAEFNIYCDPEAAAVVFGSGIPIFMAGLNVTRQAGIGRSHIERLRASGGRVGSTFAGLLDFYLRRTQNAYKVTTAAMHDPCAIIPLVEPALISHQAAHVHIELASPQLRGMTACDLRGLNAARVDSTRKQQATNAQVAIAIDGIVAVDRVIDAILTFDEGRAVN